MDEDTQAPVTGSGLSPTQLGDGGDRWEARSPDPVPLPPLLTGSHRSLQCAPGLYGVEGLADCRHVQRWRNTDYTCFLHIPQPRNILQVDLGARL